VKAARDGAVASTGYNAVYGNYVILSHADQYQTMYAHLSTVSVKTGQRVIQGAKLGGAGSTGQSTGPHVHFALYKGGVAINPLDFLKK